MSIKMQKRICSFLIALSLILVWTDLIDWACLSRPFSILLVLSVTVVFGLLLEKVQV